MLNTIRGLIKEKTDFLEAADIIFEDVSGNNLDDAIILGEESEDIPEDEINLEDGNDDDDDDDEKKDEPEEKGKEDNDDENIDDIPLEDEPVSEPEEPVSVPAEQDNDIMDMDLSDEEDTPLPGEDLPEPIGRQTGEPINPTDDFLNIEIDLGSNTQKDVLPIPPSNAGDMIPEDTDSQHVDSGFENEDAENTPSEPVAPPSPSPMEDIIESFFPFGGNAKSSTIVEAITIGDDAGEEKPSDGNDAPAEDTAATDEPAEGEESEVTSAVRDKVAEVEDETPEASTSSNKEDLLKKLGNITKSLEDAKKAVMNSIQ